MLGRSLSVPLCALRAILCAQSLKSTRDLDLLIQSHALAATPRPPFGPSPLPPLRVASGRFHLSSEHPTAYDLLSCLPTLLTSSARLEGAARKSLIFHKSSSVPPSGVILSFLYPAKDFVASVKYSPGLIRD